MQSAIIILVFLLTYIGMAAGRLPWLQVDRTGIALLGVILLLGSDVVTLDDIGASIDMPTLVLLFALMIISAQFAASGFFDLCARQINASRVSPAVLLALTVGVAGGLSAVLANDILVFALTPLLIAGVRARGLDPRPFLIALAAATNTGSAATVLGAPQNILIGELGNLDFATFLLACGIPALVSLVIIYVVIWAVWHHRMANSVMAISGDVPEVTFHPHDRNQTIKGAVATLALVVLFATSLPRVTGALVIAAILLANRKFASRTMIAAVDWPLLLLFASLLGITGALANTGLPWTGLEWLKEHGLMPDNLAVLTPMSLLMTNTIGSIPSVILLMQVWPSPPKGALYALALLSSFSANLLLVGSLSNLIITERAATYGVRLTFAEFARVGVPITVLSMAIAVTWLAWMGWLPIFSEPG